jgi:hypothetical protein
MRLLGVTWLTLLLSLFSSSLGQASPPSQKYAPLVGRWRIELNIKGERLSLEFETEGQGVYGFGTGYLVFYRGNESSREYPAAWSNTDPQKIRISGEVVLARARGIQRGTLLLRTTLSPGEEIKGDAILIDDSQAEEKGTFTMTRLLGPDQIMRRR